MLFFVAVMKPGLVQVTENDGSIKKFIVSSGTITVNADSSVQVVYCYLLACVLLLMLQTP